MLVDREASAMLDCEDVEKQGNANCKHCQGGESSQQQRYWDIPLDADLLETIAKIYPDWFKDCNMNDTLDTEDKNKESLKVKLMLRRPPLNKRADQGILPPLKSPPAFHEQIQKLERTNMGDILKHKFQKKQDRQELVQHHILDDLDSSLLEKQKLKKARLSDALSPPDHLTKGVAEELLAQAVRDNLNPSPRVRTTFEEDSGSDGAFSPSPPYDFSEHSQSSVPSLEACDLSPVSPASSVSSPACLPPPSSHDHVTEYLVLHHPPPPCKNRKKAKPKPQQPKTKQMKFHEYKGPPSAQKPSSGLSTSSSAPESYEVPLNPQQHQLLIQLQMECEQQQAHGSRQQVASVQQRPTTDQPVQTLLQKTPTIVQQPAAVQPPLQQQQQQQQLFEAPTSPQKLLLSNFEDLKVTDLKAELKKKGLPVSGSKPQLIQRLRSHVPQLQTEVGAEDLSSSDAIQNIVSSLVQEEDPIANDHIVQLQQIMIENLTREVERSREQLRECQLPPTPKLPSTPPPSLPKTPAAGDNKKQIIQQLLQQKIQQQELQKRQQNTVVTSTPSSTVNSTLTALLESGPLNAPPPTLDMDLDLPSQSSTDDVVDFGSLDVSTSEDDFAGVLPIYICTPDALTTTQKTDHLPPPNAISNRSSSLPSFAVIRPSKPSPTRSNTDPQFQLTRQPPNYNEATRQLKVKQHHLLSGDGNPRQSKKHKSSVKSQAVDDVLDILISSGELSPSAAQEPITPKGGVVFPSEPFFPSSAPKEVPSDHLHLSSLQSVLDLTPPPSTGFSAGGAVDFDFPLDLDLEGLDSLQGIKKQEQLLPMVDMQERPNDRSMDNSDFIEWLGELEGGSSGHSVSTAFQPSSASYGDSLLLDGHDALNFFTVDDMDFKPPSNDFAFMPWSEHAT